jgi:hypothetical protein
LNAFVFYFALLGAALPIAATVFIVARQYDVYVAHTSSAILVSTAVSMISVSALLLVLQHAARCSGGSRTAQRRDHVIAVRRTTYLPARKTVPRSRWDPTLRSMHQWSRPHTI